MTSTPDTPFLCSGFWLGLESDAALASKVEDMQQQSQPTGTENRTTEWRVGQLAELTGVTVRTLRYYDPTGLLQPSGQTSGGHRVYDQDNVTRLYRILALRRLGSGLAEIRSLLDDPQWDLQAMVTGHIAETERMVATATQLAAHLRMISGELDRSCKARPETLFTIMEEMTMMEPPTRGTTTLLVYHDLAAAHTYLAQTFSLTPGALEHDADGRVVHGELFAGDHAIWLHPTGEGYRSPRQLGAASSMTVIAVDSADDHHAHAAECGAEIVEGPISQPYGVREYGARHP